jgi:acetolactate synthase-1/2/3 large subunit
MREQIKEALETAGPVVIDVVLDERQNFSPRVSSEKKPDGRIVSKPLEDMFPFLPRDEFRRNMIIDPIDEGEE